VGAVTQIWESFSGLLHSQFDEKLARMQHEHFPQAGKVRNERFAGLVLPERDENGEKKNTNWT